MLKKYKTLKFLYQYANVNLHLLVYLKFYIYLSSCHDSLSKFQIKHGKKKKKRLSIILKKIFIFRQGGTRYSPCSFNCEEQTRQNNGCIVICQTARAYLPDSRRSGTMRTKRRRREKCVGVVNQRRRHSRRIINLRVSRCVDKNA